MSMIEPSMGDVLESPYIISVLRITPTNSAAPIILGMSRRSIRSPRCHSRGTSEKRAVTASDPDTMAIGSTQRGSTRL